MVRIGCWLARLNAASSSGTSRRTRVFDPSEQNHTLKIEFDSRYVLTKRPDVNPQWEGMINFMVKNDPDEEWNAYFLQIEKLHDV